MCLFFLQKIKTIIKIPSLLGISKQNSIRPIDFVLCMFLTIKIETAIC